MLDVARGGNVGVFGVRIGDGGIFRRWDGRMGIVCLLGYIDPWMYG